MATLASRRIAELLQPFYPEPSGELLERLSLYLDLLLKWNARTNLTAVRDPEEIVRRHFGESLFAARHLPACRNLLDLGSGAGFPGIPIQLAHPEIEITLAESQNKKAAFLREALRTLGLPAKVWAGRAEALPAGSFDVVALRAVDHPQAALATARTLVRSGGWVLHLAPASGASESSLKMPGSATVLNLDQVPADDVPRGTFR
jgi:16S rRNA (guanine527-N7)-methyltransferase